jgi:hypothetical protein
LRFARRFCRAARRDVPACARALGTPDAVEFPEARRFAGALVEGTNAMRTNRATGLALAIALFAATSAWAATETITGRVVSKDAANNAITVQTDAGQSMTFRADSNTALQRAGGSSLTMNDVKVGDRVQVMADTTTGQQPAATRVEVMDTGMATGTAAATPPESQTDHTGKAATTESAEPDQRAAATGNPGEMAPNDRVEAQTDNTGKAPHRPIDDTKGSATDATRDEGVRVAQADRMDEDDDVRAERLPDTAGFLPLVGVAGGVASLLGLALRRARG